MALVFVGRVLAGTNQRRFGVGNMQGRRTGEAEQLQRLMTYARSETETVRKADLGVRYSR
jgi:hypothetical protein